ncbi:hypothetical protein KM043_017918 [Ampulex compressa]|nr:hypothetical protein KM043_017918 [Ampulex compressa]
MSAGSDFINKRDSNHECGRGQWNAYCKGEQGSKNKQQVLSDLSRRACRTVCIVRHRCYVETSPAIL